MPACRSPPRTTTSSAISIEQCSVEVAEDADCPAGKTQLVVDPASTIVQRRNDILRLLAGGDRTPMSGTEYSAADYTAAIDEPAVLGSQATPRWVAPHFVWAVRDELTTKLCGPDADTCKKLEQGGFRVITTLDVRLQKIAEKWVKAAAIVPHAKDPAAAAKALGFKSYQNWMQNLANKNVRNGSLVAMDYQTGEIVAYVGSADYYATKATKRFQPQYDVAGRGYRQPGSAFKPFNYATAINDGKLTAGSMLMDSATDFGGGYTPNDADNLERGPVRVRNALQFSLNIPSVKTTSLNGVDHVFQKAQDFGMQFQSETSNAALALGLGVQEVRPVDLTTAYATLANGGEYIGHTTILKVTDTAGKPVVDPYKTPKGKPAVSEQAAWIVTDILAGNTNPNVNPYWGQFAIDGPDGRRPATLKTGTNNDAKDLNAYGYIAPPTKAGRADGAYALVAGAWNGNSDNSPVSTAARPVFSIDVSTFVWQGFMEEASKSWPETNFKRPDGLERVAIDPWTGLRAAKGGDAVNEWFIAGSAPRQTNPTDQCGIDVVGVVGIESGHDAWMKADQNWITRAEKGPGTRGGPNRTATSYFYNRSVPAVRRVVGRARRGPRLRPADPIAFVRAVADTRRERRDPVRGADPDTVRLVRAGRPVPTGVAVRLAVGVGAARGDAHPDTRADTDPDADARTHADPDPRAHADPDTDPAGAVGVRAGAAARSGPPGPERAARSGSGPPGPKHRSGSIRTVAPGPRHQRAVGVPHARPIDRRTAVVRVRTAPQRSFGPPAERLDRQGSPEASVAGRIGSLRGTADRPGGAAAGPPRRRRAALSRRAGSIRG